MKIAAITDDGVTISQHFGRAPYYLVAHIDNGKVIKKEMRDKAGHHTFAAMHEEHTSHEASHGFDPGSHAKHQTMASPISDCQLLLAGGMGRGAYQSLKSFNIEPVVTDIELIEDALNRYLAGNLPNLLDRLH